MAPINGWQGRRARPGLLSELGDDLIGAPHVSVSGERGSDTPSGLVDIGSGPLLGLGRTGSLQPFLLFPISFLFSIFMISEL
jgi:hypothetical protein